MSDEQFRFIGARFEDLEKQMRVLAEANLAVHQRIDRAQAETNERFDGIEANLARFAVRVSERFDKLENRFDTFETETAKRFGTFETETAKRFDKLEKEGAETRQQLEVFRDDTQQRLTRIEGHLSLKSSPSSRTPPRATRTSLTRRRKKS